MAPEKLSVTDSHLGRIRTISGLDFDYANPQPSMISIEDIARGLSNECRFGGQLKTFYSVAQHSVMVSYMVPPRMAREGLLHDAHESVYKDIPKPLKNLIGAQYNHLTNKYDCALREKFDLLHELDCYEIKCVDKEVLILENDFLRHDKFQQYLSLVLKYDMIDSQMKFPIWQPYMAYKFFMKRYKQLFTLNSIRS